MVTTKCSGCGRRFDERPNEFCPNASHWRAWAKVVESTVIGLVTKPFENTHTCGECGSDMLKPVSLWRCSKHPNEHTATGPEIGFEIREWVKR